ncbi:MAG: hypothetical protein GY898_19915 [Proteobacteria bacterium]|nr:hypothetical protein [Pseudomonadota bacterium]
MAGDFVGWLLERGKTGGIVALLIGLALLAATAIDYSMTGGFFVVMPGLAAMAILLGAALIALDKPSLRGEFKEPTARPLDDGIVRALEGEAKPFLLCMSCKKSTPFTPCMHCDKGIDVMTIDTDDDLQLAFASMA